MYGSLGAAQRWGEHYAQVFGGGRIFPRRGFSVPLLPQRLANLHMVHGDEFFIAGRRERRKHGLSLLRSAYELSKVAATMGNRVRARPSARFPRLKGFGTDRC